jgi:hypothetical protein
MDWIDYPLSLTDIVAACGSSITELGRYAVMDL